VRNRIQKHKYKDRKTFLALRAKIQGQGDPNVFRLGGSDIGCILGVDPYRSAKAYFYTACEYVQREDIKKPEMHRGVLLEGVNYKEYWRYINPKDPSDEAYLDNWYGPKKIYRSAKKSNQICVNEKYPFLMVSPDYEFPKSKYNQRGILELKSGTWRAAEKFEAGISTSYIAQTYMQMLVMGVTYGELLNIEDATTIKLFTFSEIPDGIKNAIIEKSKIFHDKVLEGKKIVYNRNLSALEKEQMLDAISPEDDQPDLFKEFIKKKHWPENATQTVLGDGDQLQTVITYLLSKEEIKKLTDENTKNENIIRGWFKAGIGTIDFGGPDKCISYKDKLNVPKRLLNKFA
jgi:YqaJ-like viral recombinase domain